MKSAPPNLSYVYVLVRRDLPHPHLSVQIGHAVLAATNAFGNPNVTHPNLVICAVDNEQQLADAFNRLKDAGVPCCSWSEEDMGGELTAVATGMLQGEQRRHLRGFRLLR